IVASPFAKKGYVSHTVTDSTAILKFIETRFGLPNLNKRDASVIDNDRVSLTSTARRGWFHRTRLSSRLTARAMTVCLRNSFGVCSDLWPDRRALNAPANFCASRLHLKKGTFAFTVPAQDLRELSTAAPEDEWN